MDKAIAARVKNMGHVTVDRARAEAALQRAIAGLGLSPLKVRWVKNYHELSKIDGWGPAQGAFGQLPLKSTRLIDDRVYNFLNPQSSWQTVATTAAVLPTRAVSAYGSGIFGRNVGDWNL